MVDRPDLDEFLGALSGFVSKKNTPSNQAAHQDPSYFRFLEIFCRSVGSSEGHLLQHNGTSLQSVVSCGVAKDFDKQFNTAAASAGPELSPLDRAYRDQLVTAVVELKRESGMPGWFTDFIAKNRYKALVAVPLIGQTRPVGVLCAYYRDVCLFDQGTMDRLMTIGRMVGTAIENSDNSSTSSSMPVETSPAGEAAIDTYLSILTGQVSTQLHVFEALTKAATKALLPMGIVCGPLRAADELFLTVVNGTGIPPTAISHRITVPPLIAQQLLLGRGTLRQNGMPVEALGALKPLIASKSVSTICQPIVWRKQPQAAVIAWRSDKNPFTEADELMLGRLAGISSLVLRAL